MTDFLEQVIAERRADIAAARAAVPDDQMRARAQVGPRRPLDQFYQKLRHTHPLHLAVIAEVKRVSPASGVLVDNFDIVAHAARYVAAGATAISVLTERRHWGGSLADLVAVRAAVDVPILAKDVFVDAYQIYEARAAGADAVLLIAEALEDDVLRQLIAVARNLRKPSDIDVGRVRQLHTFVHADQILVAESGITSVDDARMLPARVDAVLVGTALMRETDPAPLVQELAAIPRPASGMRAVSVERR